MVVSTCVLQLCTQACYLLWVFHINWQMTSTARLFNLTMVKLSTWHDTCFLALLYVVFSWGVLATFLYAVVGQMWYMIVSIPDLCFLSYFYLTLYLPPLSWPRTLTIYPANQGSHVQSRLCFFGVSYSTLYTSSYGNMDSYGQWLIRAI